MVICFYPGAGGNRLLRATMGEEYQTLGRSYDLTITTQDFKDRYPHTQDHRPLSKKHVLTHCMNTTLVKKIWPDHEIYVIIANQQTCLRREWMLEGHERYLGKKVQQDQFLLKKELYDAIKDTTWPDITCGLDLDQLPKLIHEEFYARWQDVAAPINSPVQMLKQRYHDMIDSALAAIQWHKEYYKEWPVDVSRADHLIDLAGLDEFAVSMTQELLLYDNQLFDDCWGLVHG